MQSVDFKQIFLIKKQKMRRAQAQWSYDGRESITLSTCPMDRPLLWKQRNSFSAPSSRPEVNIRIYPTDYKV